MKRIKHFLFIGIILFLSNNLLSQNIGIQLDRNLGIIESILIKQGKMPTLAKFISDGAYGKIKTLDPPLSPMLWTSMATGYRADKHGILGFIEPLADNSGVRPVTSTSSNTRFNVRFFSFV